MLERNSHNSNPVDYFFSDAEKKGVWAIDGEKVLILGRAYRLLLELSHPKTAKLIYEKANLTYDRLRKTVLANNEIIFGTHDEALSRARIINQAHRASSTDGGGDKYSAQAPELMSFVFRMRIMGVLNTFDNLVHPLTPDEKDLYVLGLRKYGGVLGVPKKQMPDSYQDLMNEYKKDLENGLIQITPAAKAIAQKIGQPFGDSKEAIDFLLPSIKTSGLARNLGNTIFEQFKPYANNLNLLVTKGLLPDQLRKMYGFSWSREEQKSFDGFSLLVRSVMHLVPKNLRFVPQYYRYLLTQD